MENLLNETKFEEHIASYLAGSDLYNQRSSTQLDIEKLCDVGDVGAVFAPAACGLE